MGEHGLYGFDEFASAGGWESAEVGEVGGDPDDLAGIGGAGGMALTADCRRDSGGEGDECGVDAGRVSGGGVDGLLPFGVSDAGRVAGSGVK
jgi:hypothetical protein